MRTIILQLGIAVRICALITVSLFFSTRSEAQLKIDYGKSYVNVTKGTTGGTIEPGDILEIRATFVVGGSGVNDYADSCAYFDAIPANTTYIPNSLAILTNEGKVYKSFTDIIGDDAGWISGSNVQINLGYKNAPTATATRRGRIKYNDKPSFFGGTCIMVASYRVQVTGAYGTKVSIGGGTISYLPFGASLTSITFPIDSIMVFKNLGICTNTSPTNAIISESGGTFGSGKAKNRGPSGKISNSYTYANFSSNMPNDYYYNISNNTSTGGAGYSTSNAWPIPDNSPTSHRVFGVWDIIGDHTGAVNPALGNPPTDTINSTGGYMAVINASYKTDIAFLDTVSNLCPNTYYQYYAWFRNICSKCACDSSGKGPSNTGYIPTGPGDSSGVHPNLTFNVNGYDYYTTGDIAYSGQWVRKGFTYLTGPTQTSMIIYIRNNAPGGGGNDWAIDDIGIASCIPNISLTPNKPDTLCQGSDDTVRFKVTAFFANYTEWRLERSIDNGATWSSPGLDTLGNPSSGSATPVYNASTNLYEYLVTRYYRLNVIDTKIIYRLTVASTAASLNNASCAYITSSPKIVFAVNCLITLPTTIVFGAQLQEGTAMLQWTSTHETGNIKYIVERSDNDQSSFKPIATMYGHAPDGSGDTYNFIDPQPVNTQSFYRIRIIENDKYAYSKIVLLSNSTIIFDVRSLVNPFTNTISFDMVVPENQTASFVLNDALGRIVKQEIQPVSKGFNSIRIYGLESMPTGIYILQIRYADKMITKRVIKRIE
ncbi:MAG: T9SS type A sorting domain-containing protein [Bacteroidetes bacterium]|nr:T9SS type A sorting domain-containing protein [Bacteroidota bacterium]